MKINENQHGKDDSIYFARELEYVQPIGFTPEWATIKDNDAYMLELFPSLNDVLNLKPVNQHRRNKKENDER